MVDKQAIRGMLGQDALIKRGVSSLGGWTEMSTLSCLQREKCPNGRSTLLEIHYLLRESIDSQTILAYKNPCLGIVLERIPPALDNPDNRSPSAAGLSSFPSNSLNVSL